LRPRRALEGIKMAGPQGLEPQPTVPETVVLPLDDGPALDCRTPQNEASTQHSSHPRRARQA
jgi:hypothetical protein